MKKQVDYIVLHCQPLSQDTIIDTIKQYWQKQECWKNPGFHYIVSATGKIEELVLESGSRGGVKGQKRNSVHFSLVMPATNSNEDTVYSAESQIEAMLDKVRELKAANRDACIALEFDLSEN